MSQIKHPDIEVQLSDQPGNAFAIIARVSKALRRAGVSSDEIKKFQAEAKSGDYSNVLNTCEKWVDVY